MSTSYARSHGIMAFGPVVVACYCGNLLTVTDQIRFRFRFRFIFIFSFSFSFSLASGSYSHSHQVSIHFSNFSDFSSVRAEANGCAQRISNSNTHDGIKHQWNPSCMMEANTSQWDCCLLANHGAYSAPISANERVLWVLTHPMSLCQVAHSPPSSL